MNMDFTTYQYTIRPKDNASFQAVKWMCAVFEDNNIMINTNKLLKGEPVVFQCNTEKAEIVDRLIINQYPDEIAARKMNTKDIVWE